MSGPSLGDSYRFAKSYYNQLSNAVKRGDPVGFGLKFGELITHPHTRAVVGASPEHQLQKRVRDAVAKSFAPKRSKLSYGSSATAGSSPMSIGSIRRSFGSRNSSRRSSASSIVGGRGRKRRFVGKYRYVGPFKRPKRRRPGMFAKRGCSVRVEAAGNLSQDKCLYIGHGTGATEQIAKVLFQSIVRRLAVMIGYKPTSIDDRVSISFTNPIGQVGFRYTTGSTSAQGQNSDTSWVVIGATETWADVSSNLRGLFQGFGPGDRNLDVSEFIIRRYNDSATPIVVDEKIMQVRSAKVKMYIVSEMKIQNRTKAHTEAGLESSAAAQSAMNVENNPLEGKVYFKKGNLFKLRSNMNTGSTFSLATNRDSALIGTGDIDTTGLTNQQINILSRPPSRHSFVGVSRVSKVMVNPGEIKSSRVKYSKTIGLNQLLRSFLTLLDGGSEYFWPSVSKLFAFEKMMHTDDAEEPDMDIGYELNTIYKAAIFTRGCLFGTYQETV